MYDGIVKRNVVTLGIWWRGLPGVYQGSDSSWQGLGPEVQGHVSVCSAYLHWYRGKALRGFIVEGGNKVVDCCLAYLWSCFLISDCCYSDILFFSSSFLFLMTYSFFFILTFLTSLSSSHSQLDLPPFLPNILALFRCPCFWKCSPLLHHVSRWSLLFHWYFQSCISLCWPQVHTSMAWWTWRIQNGRVSTKSQMTTLSGLNLGV